MARRLSQQLKLPYRIEEMYTMKEFFDENIEKQFQEYMVALRKVVRVESVEDIQV